MVNIEFLLLETHKANCVLFEKIPLELGVESIGYLFARLLWFLSQ